MSVNIKREYEKNPKLKREDVQKLMDWADKQPHLPPIDEYQIIIFLQSCYFSNELAKLTIDNFFTIKTLCPEIFHNRNPLKSPLKEALNIAIFTVLPKQTPEDYTIIFLRLIDCNPDNYNFPLLLHCFDMTIMAHLNQYGTSNGHFIVIDMQGITLNHLTKTNPLIVKKWLSYLQDAMPIRLKGMHYFNIVSFMDKVLALMKPFMKKELIDMLYLHNTVEDLNKFIPIEYLPQDYGGNVDSVAILHEKMKQNFHDNIDFHLNEDKQLVDETKRPGKPKNINDVFGVEGTFKKLDID